GDVEIAIEVERAVNTDRAGGIDGVVAGAAGKGGATADREGADAEDVGAQREVARSGLRQGRAVSANVDGRALPAHAQGARRAVSTDRHIGATVDCNIAAVDDDDIQGADSAIRKVQRAAAGGSSKTGSAADGQTRGGPIHIECPAAAAVYSAQREIRRMRIIS